MRTAEEMWDKAVSLVPGLDEIDMEVIKAVRLAVIPYGKLCMQEVLQAACKEVCVGCKTGRPLYGHRHSGGENCEAFWLLCFMKAHDLL